ncbi:MAG: two-component regulator propeller domain-containing protein [Anditalea sp.]
MKPLNAIKYFCTLIFFVSALFAARGADQNLYFENLDMKEGLSDNTVFSILQDREGFMWFGTKNGLNRYDGHTFKVFNTESEIENGLGNNLIYELCEDNEGRIWVGTSEGVYIYDTATEKFTRFQSLSDKGSQINGSISDIKKDLEGNIWIAENINGLFRFNGAKQELKQFTHNNNREGSLSPGYISSVMVDHEGQIWVGVVGQGVHKFIEGSESFVEYLDEEELLRKEYVFGLLDNGPSILIGTKSAGLKSMDKSTGKFKDLLNRDKEGNEIYVRDFQFIKENELWITTESGLFIYDLKTGEFQNLKHNNNDPFSLADNALYVIEQDREGGIWLGTYFGGINFLPNQPIKFEKYYPITNANTISGKRVREFVQGDDGTLWIGTEDAGLNHFDPKTTTFTPYQPTGQPGSISYHNIHGLAMNKNELLIGVWSQGINILNTDNRWIEEHKIVDKEGNFQDSDIFSILVDRRDQIWLGTVDELFLYDPRSGTSDLIEEVGHVFVHDIIEDQAGDLWLGTRYNGLVKFDPSSHKARYFEPDPQNPGSLSHHSIISLYEDSQDRIWVSTEGGGFCRYDQQSDSFRCYNTKNGFPANKIYKILEDSSGQLWMSCSKGLLEFNPTTEEYRIFTKDSGLINSPFNYKSGIAADDGTLYFGTLGGFISFNPAHFKSYHFEPPIVFTGIQVSNDPVQIGGSKPILNRSIINTQQINLAHDQTSLNFDFAALSYTAPNSLSYAFKMEGFDRDWTYMDQNQRIHYSHLPPGEYQLRVKVANVFGDWSTKEATLDITVLPPFWKTNWAYALYTLLFVLGSYTIINAYNKRINKKHELALKSFEDEKEKEIYESKIAFFTNITHEIRTPLTLIKSPLEYLLKKENSYDQELKENLWTMNKNTNRLIDLSNQLLDFRKTEKKGFSLNFVRTEIGHLMDEIYIRFKSSANQQSINFFLHKNIDPFFADVDREALTKILSNLFSNAIKNAESIVQINLTAGTIRDKKFKITVSNDGRIIEPSFRDKIFEPFFQIDGNGNDRPNTGTGLGLPLALSLAEMHNGNLYLEDCSGEELNTFVLELPLQQKNVIQIIGTFPEEEETYGAMPTGKENLETSKPALLLIEDNNELQKFLHRQFKSHYHVHKAENGEQGLKILDEKPIDLVISDVMMPVMDGFHLCKAIKSDINYSHIPIILLTAKSTLQSKLEGLEMGADVYIEKPFSMEYLSLQVKNLLHYRDQIRKAFASQPLVNADIIAHTQADEQFLQEANNIILENMSNELFGVSELAEAMNMSQSSLLRKIKGISELTPNGYIKLVRLKRAAELLHKGQYNITEVSEMVGFSSPSYFAKCFQRQFNKLPKEVAK